MDVVPLWNSEGPYWKQILEMSLNTLGNGKTQEESARTRRECWGGFEDTWGRTKPFLWGVKCPCHSRGQRKWEKCPQRESLLNYTTETNSITKSTGIDKCCSYQSMQSGGDVRNLSENRECKYQLLSELWNMRTMFCQGHRKNGLRRSTSASQWGLHFAPKNQPLNKVTSKNINWNMPPINKGVRKRGFMFHIAAYK